MAVAAEPGSFADALLGPCPETWKTDDALLFGGPGDWASNLCVHEPFDVPYPVSLNPTGYLLAQQPMPADLLVSCTDAQTAYELGKVGGHREARLDGAAFQRIWLAGSPLAAKRAASRRSGLRLPPHWDARGRVLWMLEAQRAKYTIPRLRRLLLATGQRVLCADAVTLDAAGRDTEWGWRDHVGGYTGQNLLGRVLMHVRFELAQHLRIGVLADPRVTHVRGIQNALAAAPSGATVICEPSTAIGRAAHGHAGRRGLAVQCVAEAQAVVAADLDCLHIFAAPHADGELQRLAVAAQRDGIDVHLRSGTLLPAAL